MAAVLFLILAWLSGNALLLWTIGPFDFLPVPSKALRWAALWAAGLWVGLLPATLATDILAILSARFLPGTYPLLFANGLMFAEMILGLAWWSWPRLGKLSGPSRYRSHQKAQMACHGWSLGSLLTVALLLASGIMAAALIWNTFAFRNGQLATGYSVFSDFAPHMALVRSFAVGWNWPTDYPHFTGDGIHYHFLFYFLCGNLNYLGLPIDWAINLPSLLSFFSVVVLLATLAWSVTRQALAGVLAPVLFFLRSSLALPLEWVRQWQADVMAVAEASVWDRLRRVTQALWQMDHFIGTTPRDDWGLWSVNVYLNQRHFLSGLAILLLLLLLIWPDLQQRASLRSAGTPVGPSLARQVIAGLVWICLPFWHGSVLVASLLVLAVFWFWLDRRLAWSLAGGLAVWSAWLQLRWFAGAGGATAAVNPHLTWGFIAADPSWSGILVYLFLVTGLALPAAVASSALLGQRARLIMGSSLVLVVFLFTVSLTVDVTANHKYLMIALLLASVPLSGGLARLMAVRLPAVKILAVCLILVLTGTGLYEIRLVNRINQNQLMLDTNSPLVHWLMANTPPRSVFLTAPYHFHPFFYSGRQAYYGHAYYAWSAGHDTARRDQMVKALFASSEEDWPEVVQTLSEQGIDYLLVDDELRLHPDFSFNEAFFKAHFEPVAEFPQQANTVIYDLRKWRDQT